MVLIVGESIQVPFFVGKTAQGHYVIYAYQRAVAVALNNGAIFKRLKVMQGGVGHRVDVELQTIIAQEHWSFDNGSGGQAVMDEVDERHWPGVEEMAATSTAMPPKPPEDKGE